MTNMPALLSANANAFCFLSMCMHPSESTV